MRRVVSVIIPVYNAGENLRPCLDSIRGQTYPELEVWMVDDGSTDGSGSICDEYAAADPRFHAVHQPNAGASAARNAGIGGHPAITSASSIPTTGLKRTIMKP